ncbi:MAG: lipoprotein [marine bacterium B5-7]|nr:MAG: lipoprotein [marine bacterium B5-7]
MQLRLTTSILLSLTLALSACSDKKSTHKKTASHADFVVQYAQDAKHLSFSSTVAPLSIENIPSPVDGTVKSMHFHYGEMIKDKEVLLALQSDTLEKNYQSAITDFISKKSAWLNEQQKFKGTKALRKAGIVPENDFRSEQSSYNNAYLSFLQSKWKLEDVLVTVGLNFKTVQKLDVTNQDAVYKVLTAKADTLKIHASRPGIALLPTKANSTQLEAALVSGSQIKKNQALLAIGDMQGIQLSLDVDEMHVDGIKVGQTVTIDSVAFPGIILHGKVSSVSHQAHQDSGSGLPVFPVLVTVKKLPPHALEKIHVGMTAKVNVNIDASKTIEVPLSAVTMNNGKPSITLRQADGSTKKISVKTGNTQENTVIITDGLKPGDHIVITH